MFKEFHDWIRISYVFQELLFRSTVSNYINNEWSLWQNKNSEWFSVIRPWTAIIGHNILSNAPPSILEYSLNSFVQVMYLINERTNFIPICRYIHAGYLFVKSRSALILFSFRFSPTIVTCVDTTFLN